MRSHVLSIPVLVLALLDGAASGAWPQGIALGSRGPRFVAAWTSSGEAVDVSNSAVLRQGVSLHLTNVTVDGALREITRQADLEISYSRALLPSGKSVSLHARDITVAAALTEVLLDAGVDVAVARGGHMALVSRPAVATTARVPAVDSGAVMGRVTDDDTGAPIVGAVVVIEGTRHTGITGSDGGYRIVDVAAGTYTVRARYIGYTPLAVSVIVSGAADVTADFALTRSPQLLDEVVTTGTLVPTEVRALPTPITVVTASEIALQRPNTLMELFRQVVPTAVSWDKPHDPNFSPFAVRGANTLSAGNVSQMKVFLDGIEVALPAVAGVVPSSIERLEVLRGPQAAAIYGSDAIGGVIQIFTKRGDPKLSRPQVSLETSLAAIQTHYDGDDGAMRPTLRGSVRGGSAEMSYAVLGDYSRTGNWLLGQDAAQSRYGASSALSYTRGTLTLDLSGRYNVHTMPTLNNPDLIATGWPDFATPTYRVQQSTNHTLGARLSIAATRHWQHTMRVGVDHYAVDLVQQRRRLLTPEDTLLWVINSNTRKTSLSYNTTLAGNLGADVSGSLTAGFDHYDFPITSFGSFGGLLNTTGNLLPAPGMSLFADRNSTKNTGYFAQAQLGFRDALFLTGGLRAEQSTNFGDSLGTPMSPRFGLSYAHGVGPATLKVRGSWGRAIRAPDPATKGGGQIGNVVTLANPTLGPERQQGWDAGVDAVFGGGSLSFTYYDQTADDLIQLVQEATPPFVTRQNRNVGRVKNTGLELEAALSLGALQLKGHYGYARARIERLAPSYTGDLRIGDQVPNTPRHTAGASLSATPIAATTLAAGLTYVGSWREYDYFAVFSCFAGTGPCQPTFREYLTTYASFTKLNASIFRQIGQTLSGFVSVDNVANTKVVEGSNIGPVWGRVTTVGLQVQY